MPETFRSYVRFTASGLRVTEDEFDRFSEAAFAIEELLPEVLEANVSADLDEQYIEVEMILVAHDEEDAHSSANSIGGAIAHRADVLAGRATTHGSTTRTERLAPA